MKEPPQITLTQGNLVRHELIGHKVKITESKNPQIVGIEGLVVDETKNTLIIETDRGRKIIPKDIAVFQFELPNRGKVEVDGKVIMAKPEERIKLKGGKW